jgi:hypothetical protein
MCNCKHRHVRRESNEDNAVREVVNWQRPHVRIFNSSDICTCGGELLKMLKRASHFSGEAVSYVRAALTVPSRGLTQLAPCSKPQTYASQRDNTFR